MLKLLNAESHSDCKPIGKPTMNSRLPQSVAKNLPREMRENGIPAIELTGGGEPTMWPYFDELLENLIENDIEIGLVTNGSSLSNERIKKLAEYDKTLWVRFSMDASNQEMHKKIHRTSANDFELRLSRIKRLVATKQDMLILGISFIITPDNWKDITNAVKLYRYIGVNNIRFSWMYDSGGTSGLDKATIEKIKKRLEELKEKYDTQNFRVLFERGRIETYNQSNDFNRCYYQHFVWSIGADGFVYPCCIQKYEPTYALADIVNESISDIIANTFTRMVTLDPKSCRPCWLRSRNKVVSNAVEKPQHSNFI